MSRAMLPSDTAVIKFDMSMLLISCAVELIIVVLLLLLVTVRSAAEAVVSEGGEMHEA
jgi:hypothetical protein